MENTKTKAPDASKNRSRLYPRYDLKDVIEFAQIVDRMGRPSVVAVAAEMGKATNNSAFIGRVSSAKQFGLVTAQDDKLLATRTAQRIAHPISLEDEQAALAEAFSNPPLYKELIESFNGKRLPERGSLGNQLRLDYGIQEDARDLAANNFLRSAERAAVVTNGVLVVSGKSIPSLDEVPTDDLGRTEVIEASASQLPNAPLPSKAMAVPPISPPGGMRKEVYDLEDIRLIIPYTPERQIAISEGAELASHLKALREFAKKYPLKPPDSTPTIVP